MKYEIRSGRLRCADFTFEVDEYSGIVFIEDLNLGCRSVTNDMEDVLGVIEKSGNVKQHIGNYKIMYRDSDGLIDGVMPFFDMDGIYDVKFFPIQETDEMTARLKLMAFKKNEI